MIFVTVGTIRFDKLIRAVDQAVDARRVRQPIVAQIANGEYEPRHCRYFRAAKSLQPYYGEADLVVAHGGTGTTLEALERGVRLISVCNPDMQDNHQHEFLEILDQEGLINYCRNLNQLPEWIDRLLAKPPPPPVPSQSFFQPITQMLDGWLPTMRPARRSLLQRWAQRLLKGLHPGDDFKVVRTPLPPPSQTSRTDYSKTFQAGPHSGNGLSGPKRHGKDAQPVAAGHNR